MLAKSIRILDLDGSIAIQKELISKYHPEIINLRDIGPQARLWMDIKRKAMVEERIRNLAKNAITFIGSGDFHHISAILINQFKEPISVIIFDFHPDWFILPPYFACGSWVNRILENQNILKCLLIGASSHDLSTRDLQTGNLYALKNNRVEIYPYIHKPSLVFLRPVPENLSLEAKRGILHSRIYWSQLKDKKIEEFFPSLIKRLPTKEVYVSIDKDCLSKDYAMTNWEEGYLALDELIVMLKMIKEKLDIVGLDITGDYSKVDIKGRLKNFISELDHPKDIPARCGRRASVNAINEATNLKLLEALTSS